MRSLAWVSTCVVLVACGGGATEAPAAAANEAPAAAGAETPRPQTRLAPPAGFPADLETSDGLGPALFAGPTASAPAIGYVSGRVSVSIVGAPEGDRVPVRIRGPIKVRAWLSLSRLQGRATHRGRVRGAPVSLRPGDVVGVRGQTDERTLRVSVRPNLGPSVTMDAFEGEFPSNWIGSALPAAEPAADAAAPETPPPAEERGQAASLAAGPPVDVYDRPQGRVIARIPLRTEVVPVEIAREQGEWKAVRIGFGPMLSGYVRVPLQTLDAHLAPAAAAPAATAANPVPERIQRDAHTPLVRVRRGARIRFGGMIVGVVDELAYARVLQTYPNGEIDVFVAVNNDVALRGLVRARDVAASAPRVPENDEEFEEENK